MEYNFNWSNGKYYYKIINGNIDIAKNSDVITLKILIYFVLDTLIKDLSSI